MTDRRAPGELEGEVLAALWAADRAMTPAQVREEIPGDLAYTTVLTILRRLYDKGVLLREPVDGSRAFAYAPAMDEAEHAAEQMHAYLESGSNREAVLTRFLGRLTAAERSTLSSLLRKGGRAR
jgi:predicted transcriptional regulator